MGVFVFISGTRGWAILSLISLEWKCSTRRVSRKRHMIERSGRNGGRQGLNKRDLFIRQRIPKLFARIELCAQRQRGKTTGRRESERERRGRAKKKRRYQRKRLPTVPHVTSFPASSCVLFLLPSSFGPASSAIYSSYFITRPKNGNTSQTSVRLTFRSLQFGIRFRYSPKQISLIFHAYRVTSNTRKKLNL